MNALYKQFEEETRLSVDYDDLKTYWVEYAHWLEARLEQEINGRNIIVENYKKQLESKTTANEGKVREDVIKKAYIAGVEDCFVPLMVKTTMKMKIKLEELYANFKTANPSLFAEEDKPDNIDLQLSIMEPKKRKIFEQAKEYVDKNWPFTYMPKKSTLEMFITWFVCEVILKEEDKGVDWVSVEDGLPDSYGFYLIYDSNAFKGYEKGICSYDLYNKSWYNDAGDCIHPSHWMQLPNQPEFKKKGA